MESETKQLLEILEAVFSKRIGVQEGQDRVEQLSMREVGQLFSNLFHYWNDGDIRDKEIEYKQLQETELEKVINHLRNGDVDAANKVSFLHVS